jgi:hypothetical protein
MCITNEFGEPDGTASIMLVFMGLAALIAKWEYNHSSEC